MIKILFVMWHEKQKMRDISILFHAIYCRSLPLSLASLTSFSSKSVNVLVILVTDLLIDSSFTQTRGSSLLVRFIHTSYLFLPNSHLNMECIIGTHCIFQNELKTRYVPGVRYICLCPPTCWTAAIPTGGLKCERFVHDRQFIFRKHRNHVKTSLYYTESHIRRIVSFIIVDLLQ